MSASWHLRELHFSLYPTLLMHVPALPIPKHNLVISRGLHEPDARDLMAWQPLHNGRIKVMSKLITLARLAAFTAGLA